MLTCPTLKPAKLVGVVGGERLDRRRERRVRPDNELSSDRYVSREGGLSRIGDPDSFPCLRLGRWIGHNVVVLVAGVSC